MTLVQRFGSALNLNVHFHMLFVDGMYLAAGVEPPVFRPVAGPTANELRALVELIAARIGRVLERRGLVERDIENAWLAADCEAGPVDGPARPLDHIPDYGGAAGRGKRNKV